MPHKIWILDSDDSFSHLLEDVLRKAKFEVSTHKDPKKTLKAMEEDMPDLVVLEYQMSGMDGMAVLAHAKEKGWKAPFVLVSADLDNDKIRDLIRAGASGIFIKPLNVFALMKRVNQLIQQQEALGQKGQEGELTTKTDSFNLLGFHFKAFPCRSKKTIDFARKFHGYKDFKATLIVSGKKGLPFDALCDDFESFLDKETETCERIEVKQINESFIDEAIHKARSQDHKRATFILRHLDALSDEQNKIIYNLVKKEGLYKDLEIDIRFLFCLDQQLDSLFDEGVINENLYILMGSAELIIPSFKDCTDDIPFIAQNLLEEMAKERGWSGVPRLDKSSKAYLKETPWKDNLISLRHAFNVVMDKGERPVLGRRDFGAPWNEQDFYGPYLPVKRLSSYLEECRNDLVRATYLLCDGDVIKAGHILSCEPDFIKAVIEAQ